MIKKITYFLLISLFININVYAEEIYDVVLFIGQSDMAGYSGNCYNCEEKMSVYDSRINEYKNKADYAKTFDLNIDIVENYTKLNHVDVPLTPNTVFDFHYFNSNNKKSPNLVEITSNTKNIGEMIQYANGDLKKESNHYASYFSIQESYGTNIAPWFGKTYYENTGHKVVIVMAGNGGESLAHFLPHNETLKYSPYCSSKWTGGKSCENDPHVNQYIYEGAKIKYNSAINYLKNHNKKIGNKFYVFWQGWADLGDICNGYEKQETYDTMLNSLHNHLKQEFDIEFGVMIYEAGFYTKQGYCNNLNSVHNSQKKLVQNNKDVIEGSYYGYTHYPDSVFASSDKLVSKIKEGNKLYSSDHYISAVYSQVGHETAINTALYINNKKKRINGWKAINYNGTKNWYYYKDGVALTGWQKLNDSGTTSWYYFNLGGKMLTGWQKLDDKGTVSWYYFSKDSKTLGRMLTGWQELEYNKLKSKYYFNSNGTAVYNKCQTINGTKYCFATTGCYTCGNKKEFHYSGELIDNNCVYNKNLVRTGSARSCISNSETKNVNIQFNIVGGTLINHPSIIKVKKDGTLTYNNSPNIHIIKWGSETAKNGLMDYNNKKYVNIKKDGYKIIKGQEWKTNSGKIYSQNKVYKASDFCDASKKDCTVTLYLNWVKDEKTVKVPVATTSSLLKVNGYRYALSEATYQGENILCGDKIYVSTCDTKYCNIISINRINVKTTTKIYRNKITNNDNSGNCNNTRYINANGAYYTDEELTTGKTNISCGSVIKLTKSMGDACNNKSCLVNYNNKLVYINRNIISAVKSNCPKQSITTTKTTTKSTSTTTKNTTTKSTTTVRTTTTAQTHTICNSDKKVVDAKEQHILRLCYNLKNGQYVEQDISANEALECSSGYIKSYRLIEDNCKNGLNSCQMTYEYNCKLSARPRIKVSGSAVDLNGEGTINIKVIDPSGRGIKGYFISSGEIPTIFSNWISFENSNYETREIRKAGTYFIWAISNDGRISYSAMTNIIDNDNSTTVKNFNIKTNDGTNVNNIKALSTEETLALRQNERKYILLDNDGSIAGFDAYSTGYEVDVKSNKIAVYATLTSSDASYVPGYEPRTVDLDYGKNVIIIKIVNKAGRERTYTIIANRIDDRDSNNLLSKISLSKGKIDFDPYTSDYYIEIPRNTKKVTINAELKSSKASFVEGYEPRDVYINEEKTSAVIKAISEAGTVRSYIITFEKKGTKEEDKVNNSTYLSSLSIPGTQLNFDKEVKSYSVAVEYEIEDLPVFAFPESERASINIRGNEGLKVGPNTIEIELINGNKKRIYTVYVNRKEAGLNLTNDTNLSTLTVDGYDIAFNPTILDYELKIKREKTLLITATPNSNRSEVYIIGNNDLTGFSNIRIKVIAENGETKIYSIDIKKDTFDKNLEKKLLLIAGIIIVIFSTIIIIRNKIKKRKDYLED